MQLTGINGKDPAKPLLESIHNTSDPAIKVALVPKDNVENTKIQFAALHSILLENVPVDFHHNVFVGSLQAGPMTQQVESFLASKSAAYAQGLLQGFNPQDGDDPQPMKRSHLTSVELSYKAAVTANDSPLQSTNNEVASQSSLSETDIQILYDRLKERLTPTDDSQVTTEDLEDFYQQSQRDLELLKGKLDTDLRSLSSKVDSLQAGMAQQQASITTLQQDLQKQNGIIKAMREDIMAIMGDFSTKLVELYQTQHTQPTQAADTSKKQPWGAHPT